MFVCASASRSICWCGSHRLKAAGIRCPTPLLLRLHVLVMEFIGKGGWAAPRLKDAGLPLDKLREGYVEGHLYIIDVSQAVDLDHPHALDFLREDCVHVSDFFRKHGVAVMTIRELFDFIVDPNIDDDSVDTYLEEVQQKILARGEVTAEDEIADSSFIPKTLDSVKNAEADVQRIVSGEDTGDLYYKTIIGLKQALSAAEKQHSERSTQEAPDAAEQNKLLENTSETEIDESESGSSDSEEESSPSDGDKPTPMDRKAARKENKKKVKEEKREARKHKVPKAVKKKKKKLAKAKKYR